MSKPPSEDQLERQLAEMPLFSALEPTLRRRLARAAQWLSYEAGERVFWEGEVARGIYLLDSGWLKVVKSAPSGREQVVKFLGPGEVFNEIGVLANQPNPATAVALEPADIWLIPREGLLDLLQRQPAFAQHLIEQLADRVLHLVGLVGDLSLRTVRSRLARLLLEDMAAGEFRRPRWYTQAELAARLETVPDVIQRVLRSLAEENLIEVERHRITIYDREALTRIAAE